MSHNNNFPNLQYENQCEGVVVGVDEAGRGPWAGPVVAAAVNLRRCERSDYYIPHGVNDSKKLSAKKRELLFDEIQANCDVGVGIIAVDVIDEINILQATKRAMTQAVENLGYIPDMVLVDGNQLPEFPCAGQAIIKGDGISLSIAAASIIAKVTRDRIMCNLHQQFPHFAWNSNAGYGTKAHQQGLAKFGITHHHRKSFAPIRKMLVS